MPEENSIFMKTSSRALGILTQLHSETAQAMYAYLSLIHISEPTRH